MSRFYLSSADHVIDKCPVWAGGKCLAAEVTVGGEGSEAVNPMMEQALEKS